MTLTIASDSSLEIALLFRPLECADWAKAFDSRPNKNSLQAHIFSRAANGIFTESGLLSAYSCTCQLDMQSGDFETAHSKLLRYLFSQRILDIQPTNVEISSFIYLWGHDVISAALMKYRQENHASNRHRGTRLPLSDNSLNSLASCVKEAIFSSCGSKLSVDGNSKTSEHNDGFSFLREHEHGGTYDLEDGRASDAGLDICLLHSENHGGDSSSLIQLVEEELPLLDFLRNCQRGVCLYVHSDSSGDDSSILFAMPPYDRTKLTTTHGPPVLVEYTRLDGYVGVRCTCPAARLAMVAHASDRISDISGLKDGDCWHKHCLKIDSLVHKLASHKDVIKCNTISGIPMDFVRIVGAKQAATGVAQSAQTPGPSRLYVAVHSNKRLGGPGNMRSAVVTLGIVEGFLRVSCDACGNASKSQTGASKKALCEHYELIKSRMTSPSSDDDKLLKTFLNRAVAVNTDRPRAPVYDTSTNTWAFSSLDLDNTKVFERVTGQPIAPPSFPFGSPNSTSLRSQHWSPSCMGGPGDPNTIRLNVLLDIAQGISVDHVLLYRDIVIQRCTCDKLAPKWVSVLSSPVETEMCSLCAGQLSSEISYSTCYTCGIKCCSTCRGNEPVVDNILFKLVFHEIAHSPPLSSGLLFIFVEAASKIAMMPSEQLLELKPSMPPLSVGASVSAALVGKTCAYSADGYKPLRRSRLYGFSYSVEVQVFSLECSMRHDDCSLPFLGQHLGMHCQSMESIYRVELFEYFWFLL